MAYRYLKVLCFRFSPVWRLSRWRWSAFRDARDRHDRIPRPYKWWFAPDSYSHLWYYSRRSACAATPADVGTCRCCTCSAPGTTCSRNEVPSSGNPNSCWWNLGTWARLSGRWSCSCLCPAGWNWRDDTRRWSFGAQLQSKIDDSNCVILNIFRCLYIKQNARSK